jgi:hypothetical protein
MQPEPEPEPEPELQELLGVPESFASVAALLASVIPDADRVSSSTSGGGGHPQERRVRLESVTILTKRKVSKDRLCFCTVSDRVSAGARLALRLGAGTGGHRCRRVGASGCGAGHPRLPRRDARRRGGRCAEY